MKLVIGFAVCALAGVAAWLYWRLRKRRTDRMISLVALLREPVEFDPAVLARIASKAWNADLGNGSSPGEDGFVVVTGPVNTIVHDTRVYLVNSVPRPYVEDTEAVAETIADLRIRGLFSEHRAWFSCDAMGVDGTTTAAEISEWYRRLARLLAEVLDQNCLLIWVPDTGRAYPINDDTERALLSDDPLAALQETLPAPVTGIAADDPSMQQAVEKAREEWPRFVAAYESAAGENFAIKAPISHLDATEFIWLKVTALEGDRIYGTLENEPANLGPLKLGSKVSATLADLNDWYYIDPQGTMQGAFTVALLYEAMRRQEPS